MAGLQYGAVSPAPQVSGFEQIGQHMLALMLRNIATDGFVFPDPLNPGTFSKPGCIIASPSYPLDLSSWRLTRDATRASSSCDGHAGRVDQGAA